MLWWKLPIPYKIKIFIWLVARNKILTKQNLHRRGWVGDTKCQFCQQTETTNHLFLTCSLTQQIWFWMGNSQHHFTNWHSIQDILAFAGTLIGKAKTAFLVMFRALCWTLWKLRHESCFQKNTYKTFRTIILLIVSLINYWT